MSKFFEDLVRGKRFVEVSAISAQAVTMTEHSPYMGYLEFNMELNRSETD